MQDDQGPIGIKLSTKEVFNALSFVAHVNCGKRTPPTKAKTKYTKRKKQAEEQQSLSSVLPSML